MRKPSLVVFSYVVIILTVWSVSVDANASTYSFFNSKTNVQDSAPEALQRSKSKGWIAAIIGPVEDFFYNAKEGWKKVFQKNDDTTSTYIPQPVKPPVIQPPSPNNTLFEIDNLKFDISRLFQLHNSLPQSAGLMVQGSTNSNNQLAEFNQAINELEKRVFDLEANDLIPVVNEKAEIPIHSEILSWDEGRITLLEQDIQILQNSLHSVSTTTSSGILPHLASCNGIFTLETDENGTIICGTDDKGPNRHGSEGIEGSLQFKEGGGGSGFKGSSNFTFNNTTNVLSLAGTFSVTGSGTSSLSNGINVSAGCFAIDGSCVAGGSAGSVNGGTTNRLAYYSAGSTIDSASFLTVDTTNTLFGVGSTTPGAVFAVNNRAALTDQKVPLFTVASSTASATSTLFTITNSGNVGVGTTSPSVAFAVAGQCVTGDTRLRRRRKRKRLGKTSGVKEELSGDGETPDVEESHDTYIYDEVQIKDIQPGDEIQSLDEKTGIIVWSRVNALMDMGVKPIFKLTTASGKTIRTTGNHPYLVKTGSAPRNSSRARVGVFVDSSNIYHAYKKAKWQIDLIKLGNLLTYAFSVAVANFYVAIPRAGDPTRDGMISYTKIAEKLFTIQDKPLKYIFDNELKGEVKKGDVDVELVLGVVSHLDDLDAIIVVSGDSDYLALRQYAEERGKPIVFMSYKNSMAWELRLGNHLFIEQIRSLIERTSDTSNNKNPDLSDGAALMQSIVAKAMKLSSVSVDRATTRTGTWTKVSHITEGQEIAISTPGEKSAVWDRIETIERLPEERVYDIEVEGTHNFIGNDIVAHNTYITGGLGVGNATSTDNNLEVAGRGWFSGGLTVNTDDLVVLNSGNVGIGTAAPGAKLDVRDGNINLTDADVAHGLTTVATTETFGIFSPFSSTAGGLTVRGISDTDATALHLNGILGAADPTDTTAGIILRTQKNNGGTSATNIGNLETVLGIENDTTRLVTVLGNGNVGIGTTTPGRLFSVAGEGLFDGKLTIDHLISTSTASNSGFGTTSPGSFLAIENTGSLNSFFVADAANDTTPFVIDESGNVGIGTGAPADIFHVSLDGSGASGLGNTGAFSRIGESDLVIQNIGGGTSWIGLKTNGKFGVAAGLSNAFTGDIRTTAMFMVDTTGYVGVGELSPETFLHVSGEGPAGDIAKFERTLAGEESFGIYSNGADRIQLVSSGELAFHVGETVDFDGTPGNEKVRIDTTGNVGIGTTSPVSTLSVLGESAFAGGASVGIGYAGTAAPTGGLIVQGNIGIGTTTPARRFSVEGDGIITGDLKVGSLTATSTLTFSGLASDSILSTDSTGALVGTSTPSFSHVFATSTTATSTFLGGLALGSNAGFVVNNGAAANSLVVADNGNVGVGTGAPVYNIDVFGASGAGTRISRTGSSDASYSPKIIVEGGTAPGHPSFEIWGINSGQFAKAIFSLAADGDISGASRRDVVLYGSGSQVGSLHLGTNDALYQTITSSGNVGIGNINPNTLLDVAGDLTISGNDINLGTGSATTTISGGSGIGIGTTSPGSLLSVENTGSLNSFFVADEANDTTPFVIDESGNVGIGTTSPVSTLSVLGESAFAGGASVGIGYAGTAAPTGGLIVQGNIGIGTTTPARRFSVEGDGILTGDLRVGSLKATSTAFATGLSAEAGSDNYLCIDPTTFEITDGGADCGASSLRYKENIEELTYGLEDVLNLNPVSFYWKESEHPDRSKQLGLIAEEVDLVIPEVVSYNPDGAPESVAYDNLIAVVIKGVQELWGKVSEYFARTEKLETEVENLKERVRQLENGKDSSLPSAGSPTSNVTPSSDDSSLTSDVTPPADTEPPTIEILGNNPAEVSLNSTFTDPGITVTDNATEDFYIVVETVITTSSLTSDVFPSQSSSGAPNVSPLVEVDTSTPGEYTITYTATDFVGNSSTAERLVNVVDPYASAEEPEETASSTDLVINPGIDPLPDETTASSTFDEGNVLP